MRLGINGWPPIASHLLCFFIGIALINLAGPSHAGDDSPRPGVLVLAIPKRLWKSVAKSPRAYHLIRHGGAGGPGCRLSPRPLQVGRRGANGWLVAEIPFDEAGWTVAKAIHAARGVELAEATRASLALCRSRPRVVYEK